MQIYNSADGLRSSLASDKFDGKKIALVPTMGNLHDGHLALIEKAKETSDVVVCSIFVNALQFNLKEDWEQYPRTFDTDCEKLRSVGCDYLFHPTETEMYPNGLDTQTKVVCPYLTDVLCGASRPGHFEGVTTVVSKLLNIVQPHEAVFGVKDYQQLIVIKRLIEDLCFPVKIISAPIHREIDGLAMSSRNWHIESDERPKVIILKEVIDWIAENILNGNLDFFDLESIAIERINKRGFEVDYITCCNSETLDFAANDDKNITVLGAIYTKKARLIDNVSVQL
ncbi:MAG: pantoate--beta-alanine ligase [Pseudomonadota bacterium]|nr:pantoate--beta-alanine ligase [Pseudomonadota bacterium]